MTSLRLAALAEQFDLASVDVPLAGRTLRLHRPRSTEDLLCEEEFRQDERLPYWAELWPSARVLAEHVAGLDGNGRRLLDLGCGLGLVSLAAGLAGFEVLAVDYYADALDFVALNAETNGVPRVAVRHADWRRWPADLLDFDVLAASDVLYERPYCPLVAQVYAQSLRREGLGLLSDPGRSAAASFVDDCRRRGLVCETLWRAAWTEGTPPPTVEVLAIRHGPAG